jgi:hypothetical protein
MIAGISCKNAFVPLRKYQQPQKQGAAKTQRHISERITVRRTLMIAVLQTREHPVSTGTNRRNTRTLPHSSSIGVMVTMALPATQRRLEQKIAKAAKETLFSLLANFAIFCSNLCFASGQGPRWDLRGDFYLFP